MLVDRFGSPLVDAGEWITSIATHARTTTDTDTLGTSLVGRIAPPSKEQLDWTLENLDPATLVNEPADKVIDILADASPELSRAVHEMYQQVVTDYEITYAETLTAPANEVTAAKRIVDRAFEKMEVELNSPLSMKLEQLTASGYLKGAFHTEVTFDDFDFSDIVVVDPYRAFFIEQHSDARGQYRQLAHRNPSGSGYIPITSPFVRYVALNAKDGSSYGRSFVGSAIYPMIFLLGFLKAARRVLMTQAWPHPHFKISAKQLIDAGVAPKAANAIISQLKTDLKTVYEQAEEGSAFITGDEVEIDIIAGSGRHQLSIIETIMNLIQRWIVLALKQFGIVFSISSSNALSTDAEQQLLSEYKFINSFQSKMEKLVTLHINQILRQAGNAMTAVFKLDRDSAKIQKYVAETAKTKFEAIAIAEEGGWISKAEARMLMRNPEGLQQLSDLLPVEMPPELQQALRELPETETDTDATAAPQEPQAA